MEDSLEIATVAIGIDLGTTYSSVAVYVDKNPEIINFKSGKNSIPSVISYDENDKELIGEEAKINPQFMMPSV